MIHNKLKKPFFINYLNKANNRKERKFFLTQEDAKKWAESYFKQFNILCETVIIQNTNNNKLAKH